MNDNICDEKRAREIQDEPVTGIKIWCMTCANPQTYYMANSDYARYGDPVNIDGIYCEKCKRKRRFQTAADN